MIQRLISSNTWDGRLSAMRVVVQASSVLSMKGVAKSSETLGIRLLNYCTLLVFIAFNNANHRLSSIV